MPDSAALEEIVDDAKACLAPGGNDSDSDSDGPGARRAIDEIAARHAFERHTSDTKPAFFGKGVER